MLRQLTRLKSLAGSRFGAFEMLSFRLSSCIPIYAVRAAVFRIFGASVDRTAVIYHGYEVRSARRLTIGSNTSVGDHAVLDARGGLTIGNNVNISTGVQFWTAQHDWRSPDFAYVSASIQVEDRVWIGPRVTVLPGSVIGEGAVVAAGAVVRGTVAPYTLVGGVPMREIAKRPSPMNYELPGRRKMTWWW